MTDRAIPVDDQALDLIEEALGGALDENNQLVGADFSLHRLLEFWSGYDQSTEVLVGHTPGGIPVYEATTLMFHPNDVILALVAEVRRLRRAASSDGE